MHTIMLSDDQFHDIINSYLEKKREGMDYTQIRKELRNKKINDADIKKIIQEIDNIILQEEFEKPSKKTGEKMRFGGWLFTAIGIIFILGQYTKIPFFYENYLLSYGSLLVGITLLFYGYFKNKKKRDKKTEEFKRKFIERK